MADGSVRTTEGLLVAVRVCAVRRIADRAGAQGKACRSLAGPGHTQQRAVPTVRGVVYNPESGPFPGEDGAGPKEVT